MKFQKKSVSKIALTDLLRRKRTNLGKYLADNGIFSYELLLSRCFSIGVIPPTEDQFLKARGLNGLCEVSSPTEGIVVLNPVLESLFNIVEESPSEENLQPLEESSSENGDGVTLYALGPTDSETISKSKRKRKNITVDES